MVTFHILSIFPDAFRSYFDASILGKAQAKKAIRIAAYALGDFAEKKKLAPPAGGWRRTLDDSPYGGGHGMVLRVEPIFRAIESIKKLLGKKAKTRVILFSTRGKKFDSAAARRLAKYDNIILICGRYEGVDERVAEHIADEEISIGDFVLSGGELPAMVVVDAVARHAPGVLGKQESLEEIQGSYPVYTKPDVFKTGKGGKAWKVPDVLLLGNHKKIAEWRNRHNGGR
ncbi:MAG: tRNA (guanosine(37)-N1)-methyltransferase TrmD [Candidatus Jorgensenbacteria bacterium]|nr:tRNA (guanosine(37)-N1)-methyltransferase TrmD [Candidatus Jorgensenbacteria bacterium]